MPADGNFHPPISGARIILQRSDGFRLFTGYLATAPEQQYLGYGQIPAWRYVLQAVDDSCLLDHNALPVRTPFAWRTAGNALETLANDVLPGGLDESGVQDVSPVNQFPIVPQKSWTDHAQELRRWRARLTGHTMASSAFSRSGSRVLLSARAIQTSLRAGSRCCSRTSCATISPSLANWSRWTMFATTSWAMERRWASIFPNAIQQDHAYDLRGRLHYIAAGADAVERHRSNRQAFPSTAGSCKSTAVRRPSALSSSWNWPAG